MQIVLLFIKYCTSSELAKFLVKFSVHMSLVPIALRIYRIVWHHRLLTMLPVSSSFFTLRYVRVQVVDAMHPSEAGPQKKLPLFL